MTCKSCAQKKIIRDKSTKKFQLDINKFINKLKQEKQGEHNGKEENK